MKGRILGAVVSLWCTCVPLVRGEMEHRYAEVNGVKLHYVTEGKGRLMLFLHGFPEFWYAWKAQLKEFGKDHQAVAVDMRGYNLSSRPETVDQYAIPLLVGDVKALADHLLPKDGPKKLVLVGHDWGGAIAWIFAGTYPDYLEKLVIINAPHPGVFQRELRSNPDQQKASSYMVLFRSEKAEATLSADDFGTLARAVFEGSAKPEAFSEEDRRAYLEAWRQPGALTGGLNYYRAARVGPPPPDAAPDSPPPPDEANLPALTVKVPTLVIWGEKDRALLTGNLDGLDKFVPDLRIRRIPDATHWVVHEYPDKVHSYIREFLKK